MPFGVLTMGICHNWSGAVAAVTEQMLGCDFMLCGRAGQPASFAYTPADFRRLLVQRAQVPNGDGFLLHAAFYEGNRPLLRIAAYYSSPSCGMERSGFVFWHGAQLWSCSRQLWQQLLGQRFSLMQTIWQFNDAADAWACAHLARLGGWFETEGKLYWCHLELKAQDMPEDWGWPDVMQKAIGTLELLGQLALAILRCRLPAARGNSWASAQYQTAVYRWRNFWGPGK